MVKLKRILLVLLAIIFLAGVTPVFAQARYGIRSKRISASTDGTVSALGANTWVYGIKIYATSTSARLGIYDVDTQAELSSSDTEAFDEIGEATQYESTESWYAKPTLFTQGVSALCTNGVGFVYYGPEPE